jgi:Fe-S-cluster containining protein
MMVPQYVLKTYSNIIGKANMPLQSESPTEILNKVEQLLVEISDTTEKFAANVPYKCRAGCGACCMKPHIEAQVSEMLPMARHIIEKGLTEDIFERLGSSEQSGCLMFQAHAGGEEKGRCSAYEFRPSVCRLFGFSAVKKKNGPPELANCNWQKKLYPTELLESQAKINAGMEVPIISDFRFKLQNLAPSAAMGTPLPINKALKIALEKLIMADQYRLSEEEQS